MPSLLSGPPRALRREAYKSRSPESWDKVSPAAPYTPSPAFACESLTLRIRRATWPGPPRLSKAAVMVAGDRATSSNGRSWCQPQGVRSSRESQPTHLGKSDFLLRKCGPALKSCQALGLEVGNSKGEGEVGGGTLRTSWKPRDWSGQE